MKKTILRFFATFAIILLIGGLTFAREAKVRDTVSDFTDLDIIGTINNKTYVQSGNSTDLKDKLENANEGDTIYIPKGYYEFTEDPGSSNYLIDISTDNLTIMGDGFGTEIFFNFENAAADRNFIVLRGNDLLIKDMYIRGRQTDGVANADQSGTSLALTGIGNQVNNMFFMDGGHCLYFANAEENKANTLTFYNCEQPLAVVDGSRGITISDVTATTKSRGGTGGWIQRAIKLDRSKDITLSNLYVNNASSNGLVMFGYNSSNSQTVTVNNYIFNGSPTSVGLQSWGYKDVVISNYISKNSNYGIYFQTRNHSTGEVDNIEDWRISNFEITGTGTNKGIYFGSSFTGFNTTIKNIKLSNGEITTESATPVRFLDEQSDYYNITFDNVRIVSTGDNGIRSLKGIDGFSFRGEFDTNTYSINNVGGMTNTRIYNTKMNVDANPTITDSSFGLILFQGITIGNVEESPIFTSGIKTDEITAENTNITLISDIILDTDKMYSSQNQIFSEGGSNMIFGDIDAAGTDKNLQLRAGAVTRVAINTAGNIIWYNKFGSPNLEYDGTNLESQGYIQADNFRSSDGTAGYTGTCGSGTTLTVKDGLITACS